MKLKSRLIFSVFVLCFFCFLSRAAADEIIYVDCGSTGTNNGSSWVDAFTTLQAALDVSQQGDEIWVAAGTYYPTVDYSLDIGDRGNHFQMKNGVAIYGGFCGIENQRAQRDWQRNETILSGDIGVPGDKRDNCYHVFYHTHLDLDNTAILDGFTITAGNANFSGDDSDYNYSNPSLIKINVNESMGGAFNPHLLGGGMYNEQSSPSINNISFNDNKARQGGGMANYFNSNPIITNTTFIRNQSVEEYGSENYSVGGGMDNLKSSPILTNVSFASNYATIGGGMCNTLSNPTLINNIFSCNTVSKNGGGIANESSSPQLINVTFCNNEAEAIGNGIYNISSFPSLINCILWSSIDVDGQQIYNDNSEFEESITLASYSNIKGGWEGNSNIDKNPEFVRVPSSGPDNEFGTEDDEYGDLRLQLWSPCINKGNNKPFGINGVAESITNDLDGNPRIVSDTVDMGAYECQAPLVIGDMDINGDNTLDIFDLLCVARFIGQSPVGDYQKADVNIDGNINIIDLLIIHQNIATP